MPSNLTHGQIVSIAARETEDKAKKLAIAGICSPLKLYYRTGELLLLPEYEEAPNGYRDSGRVLPMSLQYTRYEQWIYNNSRDLEIL